MATPTVISTIGDGPRPSREWTIPPRPKPGRKPAQVESESKKAQNRASQRAFRERRQEYVGELEAKVKAYERADGEKSVFYQKAAQKLREENLCLKEENSRLRIQLEEEIARRKRIEALPSSTTPIEKPSSSSSLSSSSRGGGGGRKPSTRYRRESDSSSEKECNGNQPITPTSAVQPQQVHQVQMIQQHPLKPSYASISLPPPISRNEIAPCGFCSKGGSCLCHELANENANISIVDDDNTIQHVETYHHRESFQSATPSQSMSVDIRKTNTRKRNLIWPVTPIEALKAEITRTSSATSVSVRPVKVVCNGDPSTCSACANDPFGKAFCTALSSSACSKNKCASCPRNRQVHPAHVPSMQSLSISKSSTDGDDGDGRVNITAKEDNRSKERPSEREIPCSDAWMQLKAHPNIGNANLQLLADVVARRTTCERSSAHLQQSDEEEEQEERQEHDKHESLGHQSDEAVKDEEILTRNRPCKRTSPSSPSGPHPPQKRLTVERVGVIEALALLDSGLY